MRMRRVTVQLELETNVSIPDLKKATLTVHYRGRQLWNLKRDRNQSKDAHQIAEEFPKDPVIYYLESNRVNVIRESTKKRGKRK